MNYSVWCDQVILDKKDGDFEFVESYVANELRKEIKNVIKEDTFISKSSDLESCLALKG